MALPASERSLEDLPLANEFVGWEAPHGDWSPDIGVLIESLTSSTPLPSMLVSGTPPPTADPGRVAYVQQVRFAGTHEGESRIIISFFF